MRLLYLFAFTLLSQFSFAQKKGDNTIIIHDKITSVKIVQVLFDNGYVIDKNDSSFVSTEYKNVSAISLKLAFNLRDTITVMKGFGKMTFMHEKTENMIINNIGMKGSPARKVWNEIDRIAKLLGSELEYVKQ